MGPSPSTGILDLGCVIVLRDEFGLGAVVIALLVRCVNGLSGFVFLLVDVVVVG